MAAARRSSGSTAGPERSAIASTAFTGSSRRRWRTSTSVVQRWPARWCRVSQLPPTGSSSGCVVNGAFADARRYPTATRQRPLRPFRPARCVNNWADARVREHVETALYVARDGRFAPPASAECSRSMGTGCGSHGTSRTLADVPGVRGRSATDIALGSRDRPLSALQGEWSPRLSARVLGQRDDADLRCGPHGRSGWHGGDHAHPWRRGALGPWRLRTR